MIRFKEQRRYFPDPSHALKDGLVLVADDLDVELLLEAYSFGIFPWPHENYPLLWFSPDPRGVLQFDELHISKSLQKELKRQKFRISFDENFSEVMRQCALVPRSDQGGTWINEPLQKAYLQFHQAGYAHSVECWQEDELVGGIYGVYVGGVFSGESMFFKVSNASKVAFCHLVEKLKSMGLSWMDIQMVTPVTETLGGKYIPRREFLNWLQTSHEKISDLETWEHPTT